MVSSTLSVVCDSQTRFSGSLTSMSATSAGLPTRVVRSGACPIVPSTSSWPAWPMSRISKSSRAKRTASRCTLVTSGQVASIACRSRSAAAWTTAGDTPWALKTMCEPSGTSSTSSTKIAPLLLEGGDDVDVVHDLLAHVDGCAVVLEGLLDGDHRPVDARAVAARGRQQHPFRPVDRGILEPAAFEWKPGHAEADRRAVGDGAHRPKSSGDGLRTVGGGRGIP